MAPARRATIDVEALHKRYHTVNVLNGVDLRIGAGEFLTLLGPSGSGKSTLLMIIAGFETATSGSVRLDGAPLLHIPPQNRNLGVVFQNYALFPHMSVAENVAYPLRVRGVGKAEREAKVRAALAMVQLNQLEDRRIHQISGGQRQRVALARAIVFEPRVILMDEPLSALDKKLREEMQVELRDLHERLGMTTIYVTHDQREALTMSDRIAVMQHGKILQVDTPQAIYSRPVNSFVADFVGDTTLLPVTRRDGTISLGGRPLRYEGALKGEGAHYLVLRPERLCLADHAKGEADNLLEGAVSSVIYHGDSLQIIVDIGANKKIAVRSPVMASPPAPGQQVRVALPIRDTQIVPEYVQ